VRLPQGRHDTISVFPNFCLTYFRFSGILLTSVPAHGMESDRQHAVFRRDDRIRPRRREAIVDPEITSREVISRIASGEYRNISFIHEIADCAVEDITAEILSEAALPDIGAAGADLQASHLITFATCANTSRCESPFLKRL
jgi:hypothetical protein